MNPFDQFDAAPAAGSASSNPFDRFDNKPVGSEPEGIVGNIKRGINSTANYARINLTDDPEKIAGLVADTERNRGPVSPAQAQMQAEIAPYAQDAAKAEGIVGNVSAYGKLIGKRAVQLASNPREFAGMVAENLPNSVPGLAGALAGGYAGGVAGTAVGPAGAAVGGIAGGILGGTAGGYQVEQGSSMHDQIVKEAQARGIDPTNKEALTGLVAEKYPEFLHSSRLKGVGTAGTDAVLNVATMGVAGAGERALVKEAKGIADLVKSGGISAADAAAASAAIDAKIAARNTIGQKAIRGTGVTAGEMAGESTSEAVGQKLAYGNIDPLDVVDEGLLAVGQGGATAAARKAISPIIGVGERGGPELANDNLRKTIEAMAPAAQPAPQLPDTGPLSRSANIALATQAADILGQPVADEAPPAAADQSTPAATSPIQQTYEDQMARLTTLELEAERRALTPAETAEADRLQSLIDQGEQNAEQGLPELQQTEGAAAQPIADVAAGAAPQEVAPAPAVEELTPIERVMRTRNDRQLNNLTGAGHSNTTRQAASAEIARRSAITTEGNAVSIQSAQQELSSIGAGNVKQAPQTDGAQARIEQGAAPQARIKQLQAQLEKTEPFSEQSSALTDALQSAVSDDAKASLGSGEMPVYKVTDHVSVAIHPSAQNPGMVQVTRYTKDGVIGDSQYNNVDDAVRQEGLTHKPRIASNEAIAAIEKSIQAEAEYQQRKVAKADQPRVEAVTAPAQSEAGQQTSAEMNSVTNVTQSNPAPSNNQSKATKAKKLKLSGNLINDLKVLGVDPGILARISTDGIRATESIKDLGEVAQQLRDYGYIFDDVNNSASQGLEEYLRKVSAGEASPLSASRIEDDIAERDAYLYKQSVNERAAELGLKKIGGKRKLEQVVADIEAKEAEIAAKEKEIAELEAREERAAIQASVIADEIYQEGSELTEADLMQWLGTQIEYSQDEINEADSRSSEIESRRAEANAGYDSEEQAQGSRAEGAGTGTAESGTRQDEGFGLAGQTNEQAAEQFAQQQAAKEKESADKKAAEDKAKADAEANDFRLAGSDRAADVAVAGGQQDIFAQPVKATTEANAQPAIPKRGDRFKDGDGNTWEIWNARSSLIEAHPVIDGKPVVNRDSGKRFATDERARLANPEARTDFFPMAKENNPAAADAEAKPKSAKPKTIKPPKTETTGDMHQSLKKAGYERGTLPMNNREIRVGLNMDAPFSDQRFEAVINRRGDKWVISEIETPELKSVGMVEAMAKFRADLAMLNEGKWPAAEPATVDAKKEQKSAVIEDFGEKLGGARKDRAPSLEVALTDDEIASQPLSKIWPASEIDAIEDTFVAAVAHAARAEIPAKPRVAYKVTRWVEKVKTVRNLAQRILDGSIAKDRFAAVMKSMRGLDGFAAKVSLLEAIDRKHWGRIGTVHEYPDAYRYGENGEQIPSPSVLIELDGKYKRFEGAKSVADIIDQMPRALGDAAPEKKMQFEVRGRGESFFVNKKGDKEYRKLKTFSSSKEAFAFIKDHHAELVAAWDAVKESDNVKETDVRNQENRPRTAKDWRQGMDVTPEQFSETFGFRGVEFGNYVTQGKNSKERQGMLNQAFDAMMDLAEIVGIPPKAISLNGSLGLGFGSRGSGWASAHFEPGNLVINLTKTRGAGTFAHEWFHALDNYFARMRNAGEQKSMADVGNSQEEYRRQNYVTYKPEPLYVHKTKRSQPITRAQLDQMHEQQPSSEYWNKDNWHKDPRHPEGVRPEVERAFAALVDALNASPMAKRARLIDKTANGYWSRIIERGARSFENYVISKMMESGYNNDYLANVREVGDFPRSKERYPYLLPEEVAPIAEAFDNLFGTLETRETDKGVALHEESAVYTVNEPDAFTGDIFQGTEHALPETERRAVPAKRQSRGRADDGQRTSRVLAVREAADTPGIYHVSAQLVSVGERQLPVAAVKTSEDAARAFAHLSRFAVEHMDGLVTDKDGKPLAIIGAFKGAPTQANVYSSTLMMELARIDGAANLWLSHNHPSGTPNLSEADRALSRNFRKILRDTSVTYQGLSAMARRGNTIRWEDDDYNSGEVQANEPAPHRVPIVERELVNSNPVSKVGGPQDAKRLVPELAKNSPGVVFLTAQNEIASFVPFSPEEMGELRSGSRLMKLFNAAAKSGATGALVAMPDGKVTTAQFGNLKGALGTIDVGVFDGIRYDSSAADSGKSVAESGEYVVSAGASFMSRSNGAGGMAMRDLSAVVDRVSKRLKNLPKVHVLESPAALSTKDPVQKALRDFIRKAGAWEDAEGAMHEGEIYLFASGLADEARAEHVLAVHEVTHYGLRGAIGKDLDAALQNIWMTNAKVRKAAAALKERNGLQSNIEATEEVMADMTPGDLVKLQGWRRVLKAVRDWLGRAGFDKLAARVDSLLKSGMDGQAQADLLVADLVMAARDWVKSGKGKPYMAGTRLADGSLAEDVAAQEKWLTREAKSRGYASIDELAEKNTKAFDNLAKLWRDKHPADALLSRSMNQIANLVEKARRASNNENETVTLSQVAEWEVRQLRDMAGIDLAGYRHTLDTYAVRHAINRHGNEAVEKKAGQIALTDADVASIPSAIAAPDAILIGVKNPRGQDLIGYIKRLSDGTILYFEEARTGRKTLAMVSMRKYPGATDFETIRNRVVPSYAQSDAGDVQIITPDIWSVNPRLSRAGAPQPNQSTGASNNQPPTKWQAAKQKFADLTSPDSINTLIYNFQNKFIDLKNLQAHIKQIGGTLTDLNDAYLGEEMYHGKVMKKTGDFLETEIRPLLQQLLNRGIKKEEFETFLHARHAPEANRVLAERNPTQAMIDTGKQAAETSLKALGVQLQKAQAQGSVTKAIEQAIEKAQAEKAKWSGAQAFQGTEAERLSLSGMSDAEAVQVMAAIPAGKRKDMNAAAAKVDAIQAKTLAELERYGLMDKASLDAWRKEYQFYIPLHRDEAHPDSTSHPIGQGFSIKGDAAKRRTGSNEKVTNILGHIAMQREAAITRGEKNSVSKRLYLQAAQNPDKDFWSVDRPPMLKTIDPRTGFVRTQIDPMYKNKPNVLMLRIAGRDAAIVFNEHNPEAVRLAGALKNLDGQDLDVVERTIGKATRWFAAVNTQYNPIFGVINLLRDAQSGLLNLTSTALGDKKGAVAKGIPAALKAIYQVERGGTPSNPAMAALWKEFQAVGGQTGYRDLFASPEDRGKALEKELKALERGQLSQRLHAMEDWLSDYNTVMENGVRLSAYKVALDQGMSKERAASLAKNLTVNFNRKGAKAAKLGAFYAFFNASVQGTERLAKTMAGPTGRKIMMGGIALGVLQQVLGAMMMGGGDDDEWDKIPDFVKERSLIFPMGGGYFVSIPMPLGFNVLPNIGRLFAEWAMGGKDKPTGAQIGKLMNVVLSSFNPVGGNDLVDTLSPTVSDPVVSLLRNRDWTGKPIYREDMASLDPTPGFTRTKDSATPWAKGISYVVNMASGGTDYTPGRWSPTPDQIDYVIGQITGGVGREIGKAAQTATAITGLSNDELPVHKIPLVGRLVGSTGGTSGQSGKFYENIRELNGIEREIKGRITDGKDVSSYLDSEPLTGIVGYGNQAETQVKKLREQRRLLSKEGDSAGAREIDGMIAEVMKGLNAEMRNTAR